MGHSGAWRDLASVVVRPNEFNKLQLWEPIVSGSGKCHSAAVHSTTVSSCDHPTYTLNMSKTELSAKDQERVKFAFEVPYSQHE